MFRQGRVRILGAAAAVALFALAPAAPASAAGKRTKVFKPARTSTKSVTFRLHGVSPQHIVRAALVRGGRVRRHVSHRTAVRAARRGLLRVQVRTATTHRVRLMGKIIGSAAGHRTNHLWVRKSARTAVKLRVVSDTRAPETSITSGPTGTTESDSATFRFRADERHSRFECRVDDGDWRSCSSPISFSSVPAGDHEFDVRAADRAGNVDPSPAWRTWTVAGPESIVPDTDTEAGTTTPDEGTPVDETQPAPVDETVPPTGSAIASGDVLFSDSFTGPDGVITNHYAFWSPDDKTAFRSPDWEMESGCALRKDNTLWSGVPTANEPNRDCSNGSGSEIFRLWTKNSYGNVAVSMRLRNNGFVSGAEGERSWDGVKIWLRRQGGSGSVGLYTVEVNRRQGNIMIQKKCANSDVYNILEQARPEGAAAKIGEWEQVGGSVRNQADGSVKLTLVRHGETVLEAVDTGVGCAPITSPGRTGFRGDYTNFNVDDFTVVPVV